MPHVLETDQTDRLALMGERLVPYMDNVRYFFFLWSAFAVGLQKSAAIIIQYKCMHMLSSLN